MVEETVWNLEEHMGDRAEISAEFEKGSGTLCGLALLKLRGLKTLL